MVLITACENPFFVSTGEPVRAGGFRSTPQGVIRQLATAYEHKRLDLFTDLFIESQFRFYTAPGSADSILSVRANVKIDTSLGEEINHYPEIHRNTHQDRFHYWGYDKERQGHQNLFAQADRISFFPSLEARHVTYITDTIYTDSSRTEYTKIDTISAEVVAERAQLQISAPSKNVVITFDIGKQVFYMIEDPSDPSLWAIVKWFDLGS